MSDTLRDYLNQIGRIPLLTAAEEIELGNAIQKMMPLLEKENPTKEEKRIIKIGERAKKRMIQGNLRLVIRVASKYSRIAVRVSMQDLIQEGNIGLIRAAELFDPSRGYKFSTYAYWWIKQGITRASQVQDRMIKLPSGAVDALRKVRTFMIEYREQHGKEPSMAECAELIGVQPETMRLYLQTANDATSLDAKAVNKGEEASNLVELIAGEEERPEDELLLDTQIEAVHQAMQFMSEPHKKLLTLRYGLDGETPQSVATISKEYGIYRETMRLKIKSAENEMRALLRGQPPGKRQRQKSSSSLTWGWS